MNFLKLQLAVVMLALFSAPSLAQVIGTATTPTLEDRIREIEERVNDLEALVPKPNLRKPPVVKGGQSGDAIAELMKANGYNETMLQMAIKDSESGLRMWSVGKGTLIAKFRRSNQITTDLSYYLSTDGPRINRKSFSLRVVQFLPHSGELTTIVER